MDFHSYSTIFCLSLMKLLPHFCMCLVYMNLFLPMSNTYKYCFCLENTLIIVTMIICGLTLGSLSVPSFLSGASLHSSLDKQCHWHPGLPFHGDGPAFSFLEQSRIWWHATSSRLQETALKEGNVSDFGMSRNIFILPSHRMGVWLNVKS